MLPTAGGFRKNSGLIKNIVLKMINILNHNTSYKHSKFSARPAVLFNCRREVPAVWWHSKQKYNRNLFEYQSKELLCWRYDLNFFNLYSFFFGILKALHICWCFIKNNKTIVFISTDHPSDTGISAVTDVLTQKYMRECLPRVVGTNINGGQNAKIIKSGSKKIKSKNTNQRKKLSQKAQELIRCEATRKKTNLNLGVVSDHKNKIINSLRSTDRLPRTMNFAKIKPRLNSALTELKNLIQISGAIKNERKTLLESAHQTQSLSRSYHKSDGLLYKAASRRLWASFSRIKAPFFSNSKSSFRGLFSHIGDHLFQPLNGAKQTSHRLKTNYALDLNKRCLLKPTMVEYTKRDKKSAKRYNVNRFDPIFSFGEKILPFDKEKPLGNIPFEKYIPTKESQKGWVTSGRSDALSQSKKNKNALEQDKPLSKRSKALSYDRLINSIANQKKKHIYAFNANYRGFLNSIMKGNNHTGLIGRKNNKRGQNPGSSSPRVASTLPHSRKISISMPTVSKQRFYAGSTPYKRAHCVSPGRLSAQKITRFMYQHTRKQHALEQRDFYGTIIDNHMRQATKRFANSPYIQHADLVFFVNPDRNPGLASQIKKLGIPSIGIVSGLKSSAYRKQPTHSNVHDSVSYPIIGNSDNVTFVMMVVRIFVKLIQKAEQAQSTRHRFNTKKNPVQRSHKTKHIGTQKVVSAIILT